MAEPGSSTLQDVSKQFGSVIALCRRVDDGRRRRGALPARRQRRRQVDADQDPLRRAPPSEGEILSRAGRWSSEPARRARPRHRHGVPGSRDDPADEHHAQLLPGPRGQLRALPLRRFDVDTANRVARGDGEDRHRRARPDPGRGHALGRRAAVRRDRPRGLFRRQGADPRRADLGPGRQAGLGGAEVRGPGARPRPRRDLHHPQRPPRLGGGRQVHRAQPRQDPGHPHQGQHHPRGAAEHDGRRQGAGAALGRARRVLPRRRRPRRAARDRPLEAAAPRPRTSARPRPSAAGCTDRCRRTPRGAGMGEIGVGIIGTGFMGECHALAFTAGGARLFQPELRPRLEMVADINAAAAERARAASASPAPRPTGASWSRTPRWGWSRSPRPTSCTRRWRWRRSPPASTSTARSRWR